MAFRKVGSFIIAFCIAVSGITAVCTGDTEMSAVADYCFDDGDMPFSVRWQSEGFTPIFCNGIYGRCRGDKSVQLITNAVGNNSDHVVELEANREETVQGANQRTRISIAAEDYAESEISFTPKYTIEQTVNGETYTHTGYVWNGGFVNIINGRLFLLNKDTGIDLLPQRFYVLDTWIKDEKAFVYLDGKCIVSEKNFGNPEADDNPPFYVDKMVGGKRIYDTRTYRILSQSVGSVRVKATDGAAVNGDANYTTSTKKIKVCFDDYRFETFDDKTAFSVAAVYDFNGGESPFKVRWQSYGFTPVMQDGIYGKQSGDRAIQLVTNAVGNNSDHVVELEAKEETLVQGGNQFTNISLAAEDYADSDILITPEYTIAQTVNGETYYHTGYLWNDGFARIIDGRLSVLGEDTGIILETRRFYTLRLMIENGKARVYLDDQIIMSGKNFGNPEADDNPPFYVDKMVGGKRIYDTRTYCILSQSVGSVRVKATDGVAVNGDANYTTSTKKIKVCFDDYSFGTLMAPEKAFRFQTGAPVTLTDEEKILLNGTNAAELTDCLSLPRGVTLVLNGTIGTLTYPDGTKYLFYDVIEDIPKIDNMKSGDYLTVDKAGTYRFTADDIPDDLSLYVAKYDNNRLADLSMFRRAINRFSESVDIEFPRITADDQTRLFAWDEKTMRPYSGNLTGELKADAYDSTNVLLKEDFEPYFYKEEIQNIRFSTEQNVELQRDAAGNQQLKLSGTNSGELAAFSIPAIGEKYIFQFDIMASGGKTELEFGSRFCLSLMPDGRILMDEDALGSMKQLGYTNIALAIDPVYKTAKIYLDGLAITDTFHALIDTDRDPWVRILSAGSASGVTVKVDNLLCYTGEKLIDISKYGGFLRERLATPEEAMAQGGNDAISFHCLSSRAVIDNQRVDIGQNPKIRDGVYYVPQKIAELGYHARVEESDGVVSVDGVRVNGFKEDGVIYINIKDLAKSKNLNYYVDDTGYGYQKGFGVIGKSDFSAFYNNDLLYADLNDYIVYSRPSPEQILSDVQKTSGGVHPRIGVKQEDFDRVKKEVNTDATKKRWFLSLKQSADAFVANEELPSLALTGGRWLSIGDVEPRIWALCFVYKITGDAKYAEKVWTLLEHMAKRDDWNPDHFLDTAIGCNAYAVAYDWLYHDWTPAQREFLEKTLLEKGLRYYNGGLHAGYDNRWCNRSASDILSQGDGGNWPIICSSGGMTAAIALMDVYPELCASVAADSLRMVEMSALKGFADDGDWNEGAAYWAYMSSYMANMIGALQTAAGTEYGYYYDVPGMKETVHYYVSLMGSVSSFNFGDADQNATFDINSIAWHANQWLHSGDTACGEELFRLLNQIHVKQNRVGRMWSILFMDSSCYKDPPTVLKRDYYSDKMGVGSFRTQWDFNRNTTYLGYVRGAKVVMSHQHYDHGSFVFDSMGKRWASDLGRDDYNISCYGTDAYRVRAEAHNTYVINPDQSPGQLRDKLGNYSVKRRSDESVYMSIEDLTSSYTPWVNRARRGYKLTDSFRSLTVRDEIEMKERSDFYWFWTTGAEITLEERSAILTIDGVRMRFAFVSNQPLSLSVMDCIPLESSPIPEPNQDSQGNADNTGYKKLVLSGSVNGQLQLEVKLSPILNGAEDFMPENLPFALWD